MRLTSLLRKTLLLIVLTAPSIAQERPPYLSPSEIIQLIEKSTRSYEVRAEKSNQGVLADPFSTLYPDVAPPVEPVRVVNGDDGSRGLELYPMTKEMVALLTAGEEHFAADRFVEARASYLKVIALDPGFYPGYSYVGDTYFNLSDPERALVYYDSAIALNPRHYQAHYFRGSALRALGRYDESRASFVRALARNPRHESTFSLLRFYGEQLGIRANEVLFMPRSIAKTDGDKVSIVYDLNAGAGWLAYAMAKAMWLGEPEHRKVMTGRSERQPFSTVEETECLMALMQVYLRAREENEVAADERLERIRAIIEDDLFTAFLVYEFASRVSPQVMMLQSDELLKSVEELVGRYVIVDRK